VRLAGQSLFIGKPISLVKTCSTSEEMYPLLRERE